MDVDLQPAADRLAGALADAGLARLPARVFAALLVDADGRMTSAELTEFLGVSAAGVSGAVRYLVPLGFVRREREPGSRRDVYVVDDDAWHGAMVRHDQVYGPIIGALGAAVDVVPDGPARRRVDLAREFLLFVTAELDGVEARWEEHKRRLLGDPGRGLG